MGFLEFRRLVDAMGLTQDATEDMDRWGRENAPRLKKALVELYTTIAENPELSVFFEDIDQLAHVRQKQYEHWKSLLSGLFDETYLESAKRIGTVHCSIGLEPHAFLTGYASVLSKLLRDASQSGGGQNRPGHKSAHSPDILIDAITRAALLDIGVALTSYAEAEKSTARISRLKFANSFRQAFKQSMNELDQSMDSLNQSAAKLAAPAVMGSDGNGAAGTAISGNLPAEQSVTSAQLAQSIASSTAVLQAQLDTLKSKMDEFLTVAGKA